VCTSSSDWFPLFSSITYVTAITITARIVVDDMIEEREKKKEKNDKEVQPADPLLFSTLILIIELIRLRFLLASM